jgi:hypothetical protein
MYMNIPTTYKEKIMEELKFVLTYTPLKGYFKDTPIDFDELEFNQDTLDLIKRDINKSLEDMYETSMQQQGGA